MSIKSMVYGTAGSVLCGAAVAPGTVGLGFITVGEKLIAISRWLDETGKLYKSYSEGLSAERKAETSTTDELAVNDESAIADELVDDELTADDVVTVNLGTVTSKIVVEDDKEEEKDEDRGKDDVKAAVSLAASMC